ncbi:MAG: hypothetical protein QF613_05845 [Candidatus Marinimicrobia bacterium]|jgi:hypothetical protein|nr:hypothetical protein [Candidatus Neomarinimicrobiota bacterium]MDP6593712.1 hypothetical protein [Candidatus Neomarinimicrobiota bacterium]MDP6836389.1 hypothetical protein [Candidatus Neomarinimicrobiota bacterium]|tara:strand:+ start:500 stop:1693 length:1194 start_codon:yes stop_codon:yes gene_type:complete
MEPMKIYFDVRDIFRAPRLALGGKKIWIMLQALLTGYVTYWVLTYLSFLAAGFTFNAMWQQYGLYPCLAGNAANGFAWALWVVGVLALLAAIVLGDTAVARVTYKQLKGDEFYSSSDAWKYVKKHWHAPVFTHLSIAVIALFFVVFAAIFALIGKIPYLGELFFGIPYLLWFFGSVFVVYTAAVFCVSIFFTHAIVGTMEEDTMGAVFQNYSITWSQPWRVLLYLPLTYALVYAGLWVFGWFMHTGYHLINTVFGHSLLMGSKLQNIVGWATDIVLGPKTVVAWCLGCYAGGWCPLDVPVAEASLGTFEYIGAFFVAVSLFLIVATVVAYASCIEVVAQTIAVVIFRKKTDDENLLERKDEEELELEEDDFEWKPEDESEETDEDESKDSEEEGDQT